MALSSFVTQSLGFGLVLPVDACADVGVNIVAQFSFHLFFRKTLRFRGPEQTFDEPFDFNAPPPHAK